MTCLEVRDVLPELAAGVLGVAERERIGRHLQWCAGCRKEARDLEQAAATLAFALAPAPLPAHLEDEVVSGVRRETAAPSAARRARTAAASILAAVVAAASLGWGAVMADRADRFEVRAEQAERGRATALERFHDLVTQLIPGDRVTDSETHLAPLAPTGGGVGGGFALQLVSPTVLDFVMVIVSGIEPERTAGLPYRIRLVNSRGEQVRVGRIEELDADGGAEVFHQFKTRSLAGFTTVLLLDRAGELVLTGSIDQSA